MEGTRMKKLFCCVVACIILCASFIPCSIFAEEASTKIVFGEVIDYIANSEITLVPNTTYKISGWINVTANVTQVENGNFTLQWYQNGLKGSDGNWVVRFKDAKASVPYVKDKWQHFEITYKYTGDREITTTTWIQIYNGITTGFTLKDYRIDIVSSDESPEVTAEFIQPVFYPELDEISARVYSEKTDNVMVILASYSENNKMEQAVIKESFDDKEAIISVPNASNIEKAKLFVLGKDNIEPYMDMMTLEKQNDATFIFVDSQNGKDSNNGSFNAPVKSVEKAMTLTERAVASDGNEDVNVMLKGGEHIINNAITLDSSVYSGKRKVNFASYEGRAQISGGEHITGWEIYDEEKNIYKAQTTKNLTVRQLYINGIRGTKARSKGPLTNATRYTAVGDIYGYTCSDTFLADFKNPEDMELVFEEIWTNSYGGVKSITAADGIANIVLDPQGAQYLFDNSDTTATLPVYYQNALELLDEPGEWYYNPDEGVMYYMPRHFEDIRTADVVMPDMLGNQLTGSSGRWNGKNISLVYMTGTADIPVDNVTFTNIDFAYSSYQLEPTGNSGYRSAQGNFYRHGNDYIQQGAFNGQNVRNITVKGCSFSKLGSTALNLVGAVQNCEIVGNEFYNLSATAIHFGDIKDETAVNYDKTTNPTPATNPPEEKYEVKNVIIENNYIHDVGNDYKSAVGISCGFPKDSVIRNNEICDVPFDGMHLGYGWDKFVATGTNLKNLIVENNYIHHVMNSNLYDGGGIYTLGMTGGDDKNHNYVRENYITHVENHYAALYMDNSSSYWSFNNNVIDLSETPLWYRDGKEGRPPSWILIGAIENRIFNNYTTTSRIMDYSNDTTYFQEGIVYSPDNPPDEAREIIEKSGLSGLYQKIYPVKIQNVSLPEKYDISSGASINLASAVTATTRKGAAGNLGDAKIYYRSLKPDIAQVAADGTVTGKSAGKAIIETTVVMGETAEVFETAFYVDDRAERIVVPQEEVHLTAYSSFDLQAEVESLFGQKLSDYAISYTSSNTGVANVSTDGVVSGVATGETTVKVSAQINGTTQEVAVTVKVIGSDSTEKYVLDTELDDTTKWSDDYSYDIFKVDGGVRMKTPRHAGIYQGRKFMDETIKFKMSVTAGSKSGDGFVIRSSDSRGDNCYRFAINNGAKKIQLSRYNDGVGSGTFVESKAVDISLDGSTIHEVEITARNEANGVRIKFIFDGETIIDYLDEDEGAIRTAGYFGAIVRYGTIDVLK